MWRRGCFFRPSFDVGAAEVSVGPVLFGNIGSFAVTLCPCRVAVLDWSPSELVGGADFLGPSPRSPSEVCRGVAISWKISASFSNAERCLRVTVNGTNGWGILSAVINRSVACCNVCTGVITGIIACVGYS